MAAAGETKTTNADFLHYCLKRVWMAEGASEEHGDAVAALLVRRFVAQPWRGRIFNVLKGWVTIRAFWLLLAHPVTMEDGSRVVAGQLVLDTLRNLDAGTFWTFVLMATASSLTGSLHAASAAIGYSIVADVM